MPKVAAGAIVALFLVFYIVTQPDQAASMAHGAGHLVSRVATGFRHFLNKLSN